MNEQELETIFGEIIDKKIENALEQSEQAEREESSREVLERAKDLLRKKGFKA